MNRGALERVLTEIDVGEQAIDDLQLTLWRETSHLFDLVGSKQMTASTAD